MDYPLWKNPNFFDFSTSFFYSPRRRSSFLQYRETHIPGLSSHKYTQMFDQNHGLNPLKKMLIFGPY